MITALQIFFALALILLIILFVFRPKRMEAIAWPENYQELLSDYVLFYANLNEEGKHIFEEKLIEKGFNVVIPALHESVAL